MIAAHAHEERLEHLQAQLAAQQTEFAARLARLERPRRRLPRRLLPLALAALLVVLVPLATLAATPFTDLQAGSVHNANIGLIYDAGITKGCVPDVSYCPTDTVTRQEMASFLARTAGLGANPPVANAKTLQGYAPNGLSRLALGKGGAAAIGKLGAATDVATVTIVAPAAGFILVTATTTVRTMNTSGCTCLISLNIIGRTAGSGGTSSAVITPLENGSGLVEADAALAVTYAFPVTAGTQTYAAQMFYRGGTVTITAGAELTALYVPFGYDGGTTLTPAP